MDGEEWKYERQRREWNEPVKIAREEYGSIVHAFNENVLRGVVQHGKTMDRGALDIVISELEWKIQDPAFEKLPFQIKQAHERFREVSVALKESSDEDITNFKEALDALFNLGLDCYLYGYHISKGKDGVYWGRNPCRDDQFKMNAALRRIAEKGGNTRLLEALRGRDDVCKKCPYI